MLRNCNDTAYTGIEITNQQEFLELFPFNRRSWIATKFHKAARNGYSTPNAIVKVILNQVAQSIWAARFDTTRERLLLAGISENYDLALKFAQFAIDWSHLTFGQRESEVKSKFQHKFNR